MGYWGAIISNEATYFLRYSMHAGFT